MKHQLHLNVEQKIIRKNLLRKCYELRKISEEILQELPAEWLVRGAAEFRIRFFDALEEWFQGEIRFKQARILAAQLEFLEERGTHDLN